MIRKQRKIRLGQFQNIKFIFGSKAKENKTKKERINFSVRIIHFFIHDRASKKVYTSTGQVAQSNLFLFEHYPFLAR